MPLDQLSAPGAENAARADDAAVLAAVAIPARNEERRIRACLEALADQTTHERFAVVVLANNCTDDTARIVRRVARKAPIPIHLKEARFEGDEANAGHARRCAMDAAFEIVGPGGVLMTTDADSRVDKRWVAANLDELRAGVDLVCGLVTPDFAEPKVFPAHVYPQGALEFLYQRMAADLEALLDPLPHDPSPRHLIESGASLAVRAATYVQVGGVPDVRGGEDRAFVERVRRAGGRIRHSLGPRVATSCRLDGRAEGGWADDLVRRARDPNATCHPVIEKTEDFVRRARSRGALRASWPLFAPEYWMSELGVSETLLIPLMDPKVGFEEAWARIEAASPLLVRRRMAARDLPLETHRMKKALDRARARAAKRAKRAPAREWAEGVLAAASSRRESRLLAPRRRRAPLAAHAKP